MAYTLRNVIDLSASGQSTSYKTALNPLTTRQTSLTLPISSSSGSHTEVTSRRTSPRSRVREEHLDYLPSSQSVERELLLEHASFVQQSGHCDQELSEPLVQKEMGDSDEELWNVYEPEILDVAEVQRSPEEDLVSEAKALQASLWRHGMPSRAEERKREDKRDRQALLEIIRSRKKQRRSQSFASDTSSNTPPLVPATSSPFQKRGQPSTPPTSAPRRTASADWADNIFSPSQSKAGQKGHCRDEDPSYQYQSTGQVSTETPGENFGAGPGLVEEEDYEIPWSSSPNLGSTHSVLVPNSDDDTTASRHVENVVDEGDSEVTETPPKAKGKRKAITPDLEPEIVDLVSDDDEHTWEDNDLFNDDYNDYNDNYVPHSQLAKLPPAPPIPIWVPDSPEPEEIHDDVVLIQDLPAADRDFFENHFKRAARGQVVGEAGYERQARNMALGIGTAKEAATKKRVAAAKKPWGRGGWRGRGRGAGRGRGRGKK